MKKRTKVISTALAAVLAVTPAALSGCSGDHYTEINFPAQDTSYVVTSQGGSAVAYGNYVYFINGTRGYEDTDGTANVWDEVVKGALYRAELNGEKYVDKLGEDGKPVGGYFENNDGLTKFKPIADSKFLEFKYEEGTDYFDQPIEIVNTTKIAPKTIGTAGYADGGIFIYDNAVYFASPNNEKNKNGTVQTTRTDFFMMPLSGGEPVKLYTSSEGVSTSSSAYAFYKYGGYVYLVVNESGTIKSVRIDPSEGEAEDPVSFEVGATSVYFPVRDTYYSGINNNTPEDFVYFVRAVNEDKDGLKSGTVIEAMRPDGGENFVVISDYNTKTIEGVRDGVFFYRTTDGQTNNRIGYDNLHNKLYEKSSSYRREYDKLDDGDKYGNISGWFPTTIGSDITATYAFRADASSNIVYFVGATSSGLTLYQNSVGSPVVGKLCSATGTPLFIRNNYLYYSGSNSDFYRVPLFDHMDGYGSEQKLAENTKSAGISCDYAAGYFTYFAEVDQWASDYTFFYKVDGNEGMEPKFVGQRAGADIPTEEQIKEAKGEE